MKKKDDRALVIYLSKSAKHAGACEHHSQQHFLLFWLHTKLNTFSSG